MTRAAVVYEGAGPLTSGSRGMVEKLAAAGFSADSIDWIPFSATGVVAVRKASPELREAIAGYDRVLTMGPLALMAARGDQKKPMLRNERGRLQWTPGTEGEPLTPLLMPTMAPAGVWADAELFRDFARDVIKWATQPKPIELPVLDWDVAVHAGHLGLVLSDPAWPSTVSVDVETMGFNPRRDALLSVGIGTRSKAIIIPREVLADEATADMVWEFLWDSGRRVVMHNGKFDLQFLAQWWGEMPVLPGEDGTRLGDTMLLHYLLDERPVRSRYQAHGLKDLARTRYDVPDYHFDFDTFHARIRGDEGADPPPDEAEWMSMYRYHAQDCQITDMLWTDLTAEADKESPRLVNLHDTLLMPATMALAEAETNGVAIDAKYLRKEEKRLTRRLERRGAALRRWVDNDEFDPGSPAQFARVIINRMGVTPDQWPGKRSGGKHSQRKTSTPTGIGEIRELTKRFIREGRHHEARFLSSVLAYRQDQKYLGTYVRGILEHLEDGRVHASFNIGGAVTGRMSSSDPNLHAIPKYNSEDAGGSMANVRRAFVAPKGWTLMEADYSQLELRVAAVLSGDKDLGDVYREGRDIHREVAALMFSSDPAAITDEARFLAKGVSFGVLYGRSGWAISRGDEMAYAEKKFGLRPWTVDEASAYVDKFLGGYPTLRQWIKDTGSAILKTRMSETPFGRRRRFFITRKDQSAIGALKRQAVNTPVQSMASDICLSSFCKLSDALDRDKARLISTVHDSILLEVRADSVAEVARQVRTTMEKPAVDTGDVPFKVDVKVGPNLKDMVEWTGTKR